MSKPSVNIFWFRRDLRLDDNTGLNEALNSRFPVLPVFVFDREILDDLNDKSDARLCFIHDTLSSIIKDLDRKKTSIFSFYGTPKQAFQKLFKEFDIKEIYTNNDYEPYATQRDNEIERLASENAVEFKSFKDQVIFEKEEIVKDNGTPYLVYTPYSRKWLASLTDQHLNSSGSALDQNNWYTDEQFKLIELSHMGFERSDIKIPSKVLKTETLKIYENERNTPAKDSTSRLGIHLRFGTISIRAAVKHARKHSEVFLKELVWREFFMMILYHFPKVVDSNFNSKYDKIKWRNSAEDLEKWKEGKTGFALVDAGMRQMNKTGFMHNRVRMLVASFLTKHLLIDWRWGEAYFAEKLLDYELASNNGNWQWAAGTGVDAQPYFRVFNPDSQQKKFDSQDIYIKKWIPEYNTSNYPDKMLDHKEARERAIEVYKEAFNS